MWEDCRLSEHIASKLLMNCYDVIEVDSALLQKIKKLENGYRKGMEEFSTMLNKWLKIRKETVHFLQKSEQKFRFIHRTTTGITLISATVEFAVSVGIFLKHFFHFNLGERFPLVIVPVLSGISITSSLLALSYSKKTLEDISKGLRDEKRLQRDLERIYRKGNWIDEAVQELFPLGIDLKLLKRIIVDSDENFTIQKSWRHYLCSAIVLTNIKKDKKILDDENFLPTVKAFTESTAAEMWLNRMKLRKLLDVMSSKCENLLEKDLISGSDVFLNRTAINMYPVFVPLLCNNETTEKMRFIFSSITAIKSAMDLGDSETEEFQEMKRTSLTLSEDYKNIRRMSKNLVSDYD